MLCGQPLSQKKAHVTVEADPGGEVTALTEQHSLVYLLRMVHRQCVMKHGISRHDLMHFAHRPLLQMKAATVGWRLG